MKGITRARETLPAEWMSPSDLRPWPGNPRKTTELSTPLEPVLRPLDGASPS